jgi:hypothetical protein
VNVIAVASDGGDFLAVLEGPQGVVEQLSGVEPTCTPTWEREGLYGAYSASGEDLRSTHGATGSLKSHNHRQGAFPEGSTEGCEFPLSSAFVRSTSFLYVVPSVVPLAGVRGLVVPSPAGTEASESVSDASLGVCGTLEAGNNSPDGISTTQPPSTTGGHL